jgi:ribosomal protein S18 acetylase RimI-like enzyme
VRVREFDDKDFEAAYRLDQTCYPPGIAYSRYALREFLAAPGARAWVADEEKELVAFIIVRKTSGARGHIITLDVREDCRRRGLGTELLRTAEAWLAAEGVKRARLETATENTAAVAFWQRAGYATVARLPRYYLATHDAYRMEKDLG